MPMVPLGPGRHHYLMSNATCWVFKMRALGKQEVSVHRGMSAPLAVTEPVLRSRQAKKEVTCM